MTKREVKGLTDTGRVSVKRTRAIAAVMKKTAAAKGGLPKLAHSDHVAIDRTATGKKLVTFRNVIDHAPAARAKVLKSTSATRANI